MKHRTLGKSGLLVSSVGLGCNNFGMRLDEAGSRPVIHKALDLGITLFDTAAVYGGPHGSSEAIMGKILGERRKDIVLATKFGLPMDRAMRERDASRRSVIEAVESSLRRLQTDWIDLYQLHFPDPQTPMEETLSALDQLVRQGKVRYIGCSNLPAWQVADAEWIARMRGFERFISCQNEYSLLVRGIEAELMPACDAFGLGILPYFPLAGGMLTGKFKKGVPAPEGTRLSQAKGISYFENFVSDKSYDTAARLEDFAQACGRSLLELAFSWLLSHNSVSSVIAGATKPEQLDANVKAGEWALTAEDLAEIDKIAPR
jgi:aryl-alcohol dehydrogenase-like predicted oxidoreductase